MVGDEIILPSQSNLKYVKVLSLPKNSNKCFKSVRCSIKSIQTHLPITNWRKKEGIQNNYQFEPDSSQHNARISLNLNYVDMWLVKRD